MIKKFSLSRAEMTHKTFERLISKTENLSLKDSKVYSTVEIFPTVESRRNLGRYFESMNGISIMKEIFYSELTS